MWRAIFRSLLKRCGFKRSGVHVLRHTFGAHLAQKGIDMAVIRDLLGHHSVTLTEKYYAHWRRAISRQRCSVSTKRKIYYPNYYPKRILHHFRALKTVKGEVPLTDGNF